MRGIGLYLAKFCICDEFYMTCLMDYFLHIHGNPPTDIKGWHQEFLVKAERPRPRGWTIKDGDGGTPPLVTGEVL